MMIATIAYLIFEVSSMFDYGFAFFMLTGSSNIIAIYLIFIWKLKSTLEFIEHCEEFIERSKYYAEHGFLKSIMVFVCVNLANCDR